MNGHSSQSKSNLSRDFRQNNRMIPSGKSSSSTLEMAGTRMSPLWLEIRGRMEKGSRWSGSERLARLPISTSRSIKKTRISRMRSSVDYHWSRSSLRSKRVALARNSRQVKSIWRWFRSTIVKNNTTCEGKKKLSKGKCIQHSPADRANSNRLAVHHNKMDQVLFLKRLRRHHLSLILKPTKSAAPC